jgi:hypothetical protein
VAPSRLRCSTNVSLVASMVCPTLAPEHHDGIPFIEVRWKDDGGNSLDRLWRHQRLLVFPDFRGIALRQFVFAYFFAMVPSRSYLRTHFAARFTQWNLAEFRVWTVGS